MHFVLRHPYARLLGCQQRKKKFECSSTCSTCKEKSLQVAPSSAAFDSGVGDTVESR